MTKTQTHKTKDIYNFRHDKCIYKNIKIILINTNSL
jgi:hypothetical protein